MTEPQPWATPSSSPRAHLCESMFSQCPSHESDPVDTIRNRLELLAAMMPSLDDTTMCDIVITSRGARQALYRCHQHQHPLFLAHTADGSNIYDTLLKVPPTPRGTSHVVPSMKHPAGRRLLRVDNVLPSEPSATPPRPGGLDVADLTEREASHEPSDRAMSSPLRPEPGIDELLGQSDVLAQRKPLLNHRPSLTHSDGDTTDMLPSGRAPQLKGSWWTSTDSLCYLYTDPCNASSEIRRSAVRMANELRMGWQRQRLVTHELHSKVERELAARRAKGSAGIGAVVANAGGLRMVRSLLRRAPKPELVFQDVFYNREFANTVLPVVYDTGDWDEAVYPGIHGGCPSNGSPVLSTPQGHSHATFNPARMKKEPGVRLRPFRVPLLSWISPPTQVSSCTAPTRNKLLFGDSSTTKNIVSTTINAWIQKFVVDPLVQPIRLVRADDGALRMRVPEDGPDVPDVYPEDREEYNGLLAEYHPLNDFDDIAPGECTISLLDQFKVILSGKHRHPSFGHLFSHPYLEAPKPPTPPPTTTSHEPFATTDAPSSPTRVSISELASDLSDLDSIQAIVRGMIEDGRLIAFLVGLDAGALPRVPPLVTSMVPVSLLRNVNNRQFADTMCHVPEGCKKERNVSKHNAAIVLFGTPRVTRCDVASDKVWVDIIGSVQRNERLRRQREDPQREGAVPPDEPESMKVKVDDFSLAVGPITVTFIPYRSTEEAGKAKLALEGFLRRSKDATASPSEGTLEGTQCTRGVAACGDSEDELLAAIDGEVDEKGGRRPEADTPPRRSEKNTSPGTFVRRRSAKQPQGTFPSVDLPFSLASLPKNVVDFLASQPWATAACTKTGVITLDDITVSAAVRMAIFLGKDGHIDVHNANDEAEWEEREAEYHKELRRYCYESAGKIDLWERQERCPDTERAAKRLIKDKWAENDGYHERDLFKVSSLDISITSFGNYGALASGAAALLKPLIRSVIEAGIRSSLRRGTIPL